MGHSGAPEILGTYQIIFTTPAEYVAFMHKPIFIKFQSCQNMFLWSDVLVSLCLSAVISYKEEVLVKYP